MEIMYSGFKKERINRVSIRLAKLELQSDDGFIIHNGEIVGQETKTLNRPPRVKNF